MLASNTGVFVVAVVVVFFLLLSGRKLLVYFLNPVEANFVFITWENWGECKYHPLGYALSSRLFDSSQLLDLIQYCTSINNIGAPEENSCIARWEYACLLVYLHQRQMRLCSLF